MVIRQCRLRVFLLTQQSCRHEQEQQVRRILAYQTFATRSACMQMVVRADLIIAIVELDHLNQPNKLRGQTPATTFMTVNHTQTVPVHLHQELVITKQCTIFT